MTRTLKVLVCHNHYAHAGGESQVFDNLVRGLRERGHPVVTYERDNRSIDGMSGAQRATLLASAHYSTRTRHELTRLVADERPDVAIVQNVFPLLSPSVYTTLHRLRVPVVQATYNYRLVSPAAELYSHGEICERSLGGNYLHCALRGCYRNSTVASAWYSSIIGWHRLAGTFARSIDVFQVPDRFMADKLAEGGLPRSKMVTNVNPFFVRDHVPSTSHDGFVVFAGRLVRQKGILTFLDAVRRSTRAKAVIIGEGELESELRQQLQSPELAARVEFKGAVWGAELHHVLSRACAVAVPSEWYDNLPLVLCQANALGKPVLASRINGIPEYVEAGVNGYLFAPGDSSALASLFDDVLSLTPEAYTLLAVRARQFAEERFDFDAHYETLLGIFNRLSGAAS